MFAALSAVVVFLGGFVIMVLEVIGARYLAKDFGGSFYVWISQIGVILIALALGYVIGGALADRCRKGGVLTVPLLLTGAVICLIPQFTPHVVDAIVNRHPADQEISRLWQKLDPALGSAVVFFLPCLVLAVLPPYVIRLATSDVARVGTTSGLVYAASTVGGIAGVFVSGYVLIDHLAVSDIFRVCGAATALLALPAWGMDRFRRPGPVTAATTGNVKP